MQTLQADGHRRRWRHIKELLLGAGGVIEGFPQAVTRGDEAMRLAETIGHPYSLTFVHFGLGYVYLRRGDVPKALPVLERAFTLCRSAHFPHLIPVTASLLGYATALSGRTVEGVSLPEQGVQQGDAIRLVFGQSVWVAALGEAYLLDARRDDAIRAAERALELCRTQKERGYEAWALRLLGEIHAQSGPVEIGAGRDLLP